MRLLLDSHAFLWFCNGDAALSVAARSEIEKMENEKFVSGASAWEIAIKLSLGKLKLQGPYESLFPGAIISNGFAILQPDLDDYLEVTRLPFHHRDPFDRLMIAQCRTKGMTMVSCDHEFAPYGVPIIW